MITRRKFLEVAGTSLLGLSLSGYTTYLPSVMVPDGIFRARLGAQIEGAVPTQWLADRRQYQINVKWRDIERTRGAYDWSTCDAQFEALQGHYVTMGIKVVPEWARLWSGYIASPPEPNCYAELARFVIALIDHYKPDAVELFNEPDVDRDVAKLAEEFYGAWCINEDFYTGGKLYGQCLKAIYPTIHAAHPNVTIIAGALIGSVPSSLLFLQGAIDAKMLFDAVSYHIYIDIDDDFDKAFKFGLQIEQRTQKPQVLSETSVLAKAWSTELEQRQADYLKYLLSNLLNSTIERVQWYTISGNEWENSDLIHNGKPTPAYEIWRAC